MAHEFDRVDAIMQQWRAERPDVDPSPQGIIGRLHRLSDLLDRELTANFARFDLTRGEFDVLAALRRAGEPYSLAPGEIADHVMISSGGLSKRIDRLEARGLLSRCKVEGDGRRRDVALTADGLDLVNRSFTAHMELEHRLIADLGTNAEPLAGILRAWLLKTVG